MGYPITFIAILFTLNLFLGWDNLSKSIAAELKILNSPYLFVNGQNNKFPKIYPQIRPLPRLVSESTVETPSLTPKQISEKYSESVVMLIALDENDKPISIGSGFFIDEKGTIVSNHHVLEGSHKVIIKSVGGLNGVVKEIIGDDSELDLLVATTTIKETKPIIKGNSQEVRSWGQVLQ